MRTLFIGSGEIALPTLDYLRREHELCGIVAQPDKPAGRKQQLLPPATKTFGLEHGIPVLQPVKIRHEVEALAALRPEIIVVMAYGQILPRSILDLAPKGCLNLHASILPKYRGAAPIQAALEAGESETGITVMWMDEGLDTGDILLIRTLPITPEDTGGTLHDRLALLAPEALAPALDQILQGSAPRLPQDPAQTTYAGKLTRESGRIDWNAGAPAIERKIRAMNPWPGANTTLGDPIRRLKIHTARLSNGIYSAPPAVVLQSDAGGLLVSTGEDGAIWLQEVQLEGKRRMPAGELLKGTPIPPGTVLGIE